MAETRLQIVVDASGAESAVQRLETALNRLNSVTGQVDNSLGNLSDSASGASNNLARTGSTGSRLGGIFASTTAKVVAFAGALGGLALGAKSIIATADEMKTLESQMHIATGTTEKYSTAFKEVSRIALTHGADLKSVGEMYVSNERALKQLGKTQDEVIKFTENVTIAMKVGGGSAEAQAAALTQLGQALASGVLRGDEFNSIAEQAPAIMDLMSSSLGVTTGELRKMAGEGKLTAETVYKALTSVEATKKLGDMAGQASTTISGAMGNVRNQWMLIVHDFMNGQGGISDTLAKVITKFSEAIPVVYGFIKTVSQSAVVQSAFSVIGGAVDVLITAMGSLDGVIQTISSTLQEFGINSQTAQGFIDGLGGAFQTSKQFIDEHKEALIAVASAVGAMVLTYGAVQGILALQALWTSGTIAVTLLSGAFTLATGVMTAFGAVMAVVTSPITAVVVAVGALVAVGVYLYRNWDTVKAKAQEVFNSLPAPVQEAVNNIRSLFESIVSFISSAMETLAPIFTTAWSGIKAVVTAQLTLISTAFGIWWEATKAIFTAGIGAVRAIITAGVTVFASVFNVGFNTIEAIITAVLGVIKGIVTGDMGAVKQAFHNGMTQAWGAVKSGVSNILSAFSGLGSQLFSIGSSAVEGLISGIRAKLQSALDTMRNLASQVVSTAKQAFDINSPAKTMIPVGKSVAEGVEVGIKKGTPKAQATAKKLAQKTAKEAQKEADRLAKEREQRQQSAQDAINDIRRSMATAEMSSVDILKWDIENTDKYAGVQKDTLDTLIRITEQHQEQKRLLEEKNEAMRANEKILESIASMDKQAFLASMGLQGKTRIAEFDYDVSNTDRYKGVDESNLSAMRERLLSLDRADAEKAFNSLTVESPADKLRREYEEKLVVIDEYARLFQDREDIANQMRMQKQSEYETALLDMEMATHEKRLSAMSSFASSLFGQNSRAHKTMFAMEKGVALARILLANKTALAQAWASAPFPANMGAVGKVLLESGAIVTAVNAIKPVIGQAHDGIMSVPKSGTWNLEKGERVIPQKTAKALDDKLDSMGSGGVVININIDNGGNATVDTNSQAQSAKALSMQILGIVRSEIRKERYTQGGSLNNA